MAEPPNRVGMARSEVHALVVAYGAPDSLRDCLSGLGGRVDTTVVDNSSSAEVRAVTLEAGARYIDSGANVGFSAGVNRGLATMPLPNVDVLLLNPDAVVTPAVVAALEDALHADATLACVAPAQVQGGSGEPNRVCWPFPTPMGAWLDAIGLGRLRPACDFLVGSVLLLRGGALVDVGGFDERFFMYAEEADWQLRARTRGWSVRLCPDLLATHLGAGTDADGLRREMRFHAGLERYVRKWHGSIGWLAFRAGVIVGASARAVAQPRPRAEAAARRARLYWSGPCRTAVQAGAVPPPGDQVPRFG